MEHMGLIINIYHLFFRNTKLYSLRSSTLFRDPGFFHVQLPGSPTTEFENAQLCPKAASKGPLSSMYARALETKALAKTWQRPATIPHLYPFVGKPNFPL